MDDYIIYVLLRMLNDYYIFLLNEAVEIQYNYTV